MQYPLRVAQLVAAATAASSAPRPTPTPQGIAKPCTGYDFPSVVCIQNYGAVLPEGFQRNIVSIVGNTDTYGETDVPGDPSFKAIANASFLVWDFDRAAQILGPEPKVEYMFTVPGNHEGPTWEPNLNRLYFSRLNVEAPGQYVVDLNQEPPTLETFISDPPLVVPCGSTFHNGLIYWCGSATYSGEYVAGIYALNATTGKVHPVLNNYFGYHFGTCDDLAVAPNGDIWFTDPWYVHGLPGVKERQKVQLETGVYRFRPSTGLVQLVVDGFEQPNGIAFSPDNKTVYITDTGTDEVIPASAGSANATSGSNITAYEIKYVSSKRRTVYAADILPSGTGIINKRAIYLSQDRVPDGIKMAQNGYIVTATGHGADVLDPHGVLLARVQTNFTVLNLVWAGRDGTDLWLVGGGAVGRVKWALKGKPLL